MPVAAAASRAVILWLLVHRMSHICGPYSLTCIDTQSLFNGFKWCHQFTLPCSVVYLVLFAVNIMPAQHITELGKDTFCIEIGLLRGKSRARASRSTADVFIVTTLQTVMLQACLLVAPRNTGENAKACHGKVHFCRGKNCEPNCCGHIVKRLTLSEWIVLIVTDISCTLSVEHYSD